jgi:hypothetical protein
VSFNSERERELTCLVISYKSKESVAEILLFTVSLHTSTLELSFELHPVKTTEDACALELSLNEVSFVPARDTQMHKQWGVFIRHQTEEHRWKQGGTNWVCPIRNSQVCGQCYQHLHFSHLADPLIESDLLKATSTDVSPSRLRDVNQRPFGYWPSDVKTP